MAQKTSFFVFCAVLKTFLIFLKGNKRDNKNRGFQSGLSETAKPALRAGGGELRSGGFADPEHSNTEGWLRPLGGGTQNKRTLQQYG